MPGKGERPALGERGGRPSRVRCRQRPGSGRGRAPNPRGEFPIAIRTLSALAFVFGLAACGDGDGRGAALSVIDTVVVGDILESAQGQLLRSDVLCSGPICTVSGYGTSYTFDLRDIDPYGSTVAVAEQYTRNGVQIGRLTGSVNGLYVDTFGVWGLYNEASASVGTGVSQGVSFRFAIPYSLGRGSGSNPVIGSATWVGAMVGVRVGATGLGAQVTGDAAMVANLGAASLDLELSNIVDTVGARSSNILWRGVPMRYGSFQAFGLNGRFYGPYHEEAGGVFERSGIAGAFSLARQ